jgi:hypothetical protein
MGSSTPARRPAAAGGDPNGNARNLSRLLGKLLRLDVSPGGRGFDPYAVPAGNPFAGNARCPGGSGSAPCPELVGKRLRNPFAFLRQRAAARFVDRRCRPGRMGEIDHIAVADLPRRELRWDCKEGDADYSSRRRRRAARRPTT